MHSALALTAPHSISMNTTSLESLAKKLNNIPIVEIIQENSMTAPIWVDITTSTPIAVKSIGDLSHCVNKIMSDQPIESLHTSILFSRHKATRASSRWIW